ncbi:MAG: hypothetical protein JKY50_07340 [Oleispira sp.]|nr:hypothetical protein [Oleispira sp.]MBL4881185.1 hypothetical protein [Oleispira sp.]
MNDLTHKTDPETGLIEFYIDEALLTTWAYEDEPEIAIIDFKKIYNAGRLSVTKQHEPLVEPSTSPAQPIMLSPIQIQLFGRPNFSCAQLANMLIAGGIYAEGPPKAEYKQAVFIHWSSKLYEEFGDDWAEKGNKLLKEIELKIIKEAKETSTPGEKSA